MADSSAFEGAERISAFPSAKRDLTVQALLVGERLDLRVLELERIASAPLTVKVGPSGIGVLFRYGAVVLIGVGNQEQSSFLRTLRPAIVAPFSHEQSEVVTITVEASQDEGVERGIIRLNHPEIERLQLVADVMAKSVVLAHHEAEVAGIFDQIEPFALSLLNGGSVRQQSRNLLAQIGQILLLEHKMVGRVELADNPEILWERPDLERLFLRLVEEYEVRDRHLALQRKLKLVSETVQTLLDILHHKRALRVEWYIVMLIGVEIALTLYQLLG